MDELIEKLSKLKLIKADKEVELLILKRIRKEKFKKFIGFSLFFFFFISFLFYFSLNALPGEPLFFVKKGVEKMKAVFLPPDKALSYHLYLTEKRLNELEKIIEENQFEKIPSALKEFKNLKEKSGKEIEKIKEGEIVSRFREISKKEKSVLSALGVKKSSFSETKKLVEYLIADLENSSLNEIEKEILNKAKEYYRKGEYQKALEILLVGQ